MTVLNRPETYRRIGKERRRPSACRVRFAVILFLSGLIPGLATGPVGVLDAADSIASRQTTQRTEFPPEQLGFFEKRIRPVLAGRCHDCHAGKSVESELHVDSLAGLLRGGTRGPAIVPGKPDRSLLILAVNHAGQLHMPPRTKISVREIADLTAWVMMGAPWPNAGPLPVKSAEPASIETTFTREEREFWAFQTPVEPDVPPVRRQEWVRSPIDHFVLARLEAAGLEPAPQAERRTLIRRATFDLTGLPPDPAAIDRFVVDDSPDAFACIVDRLLASPRYGERWGRRWLDVARYADSNGMDENLAYANAFRYRDYVVAAYNNDRPYDRFIAEQLAGDLLADAGGGSLIERITATGFLSIGAKMLAEDDPMKMQMDIVDDQVDTVGRAFMGLTLGCARCHDHKFDPISTADYYALAGIFKSTKTMTRFSVVAHWQERPLADRETLARKEAQEGRIAQEKTGIAGIIEAATGEVLDDVRVHVGEYLLAAVETRRFVETALWRLQSGDSGPGESAGGILIEAETFVRGNVSRLTTGYGEGIGVIAGAGGLNFAEYDVEVSRAGVYHVALRYAAAETRAIKLFINGRLSLSDVAGKVTGGWYPDRQQWAKEGLCELEAGESTIRLERDNPFPHIDKIAFVPANSIGDGVEGSVRRRVKPDFVNQWVAYLELTRDDETSVMAPWHAHVRGGDWPTADREPVRSLLGRLGPDRPASLEELAGRYQRVFAEVDRAWRQLKSTAAGKGATALADPVDEALRQVIHDPKGPLATPAGVEVCFAPAAAARLKSRRERLTSLEASLPKLPLAMAVSENRPENLRIHIRGSHVTLGREVPRRFPRILAGDDQQPLGDTGSGRLELARWLGSPEHPLTARVMVNRIWQGHFGASLVRSPDNFGLLGERPTHPGLLDYLAVRFVRAGWSIKSMHRVIMLSSTYQMSAAWNERAAQMDPENRLWWRMNRRRLEAEAIRDSIFAVAGTLDLSMGGTRLTTPNRQYVTSTDNVNLDVYTTTRRSIYLPVVRSALYDVLQAFDFSDPSVSNGKRQSTTVAPQALFMMNSELVSGQARVMARDLLADSTIGDERRVEVALQRALGRSSGVGEVADALAHVRRYAGAMRAPQMSEQQSELLAWQSLCRAIISTNDFVYVE